jgi:hypothetical protein
MLASAMRLLRVPCLPLTQLLPSSFLAQNCPGPADSFSPSIPLSYASSLGSLPPSCLHPLPLPLLYDSRLSLDALFLSPLSGTGISFHFVMNFVSPIPSICQAGQAGGISCGPPGREFHCPACR